MDLYCTRPGCPRPVNPFPDLDNSATVKNVPQKYCTSCGMPLILDSRYLCLRLLGQGGFGAAFLGRDRRMPGMRQCVIKLFQPPSSLTPLQLEKSQQLFEREAEALEDLGNAHPQIPDLYAFFEVSVPSLHPGKEDRLFYIVQEYIDGLTLEEELAQKGRYSPPEVTALLAALLPVLTFVHDRGSIHRDIKPSNIMRHRNGQINLLDFGAVGQAAKAGKSTGIYSIGFAPQEQMTGNEVFPSTDLYALGVTCIMLLTGKPPEELFDSRSHTWNWRSQVPELTEPLASVLDRMLLAAPSARYQSAAEVLAALQQPISPVKRSLIPDPNPVSVVPPPVSPTVPPTVPPTILPTVPPTGSAIAPIVVPDPVQKVSPVRQPSAIAPFSTLELLAGAAFTGFESALLAVASFSLPIAPWLSGGLWLALSSGLVYAQRCRIIERVDLVLIAGGSLAVMAFFPRLYVSVRGLVQLFALGHPALGVAAIAVLVGLAATAVVACFRLIYTLLSRFSR